MVGHKNKYNNFCSQTRSIQTWANRGAKMAISPHHRGPYVDTTDRREKKARRARQQSGLDA
jgi:hypothetical protein